MYTYVTSVDGRDSRHADHPRLAPRRRRCRDVGGHMLHGESGECPAAFTSTSTSTTASTTASTSISTTSSTRLRGDDAAHRRRDARDRGRDRRDRRHRARRPRRRLRRRVWPVGRARRQRREGDQRVRDRRQEGDARLGPRDAAEPAGRPPRAHARDRAQRAPSSSRTCAPPSPPSATTPAASTSRPPGSTAWRSLPTEFIEDTVKIYLDTMTMCPGEHTGRDEELRGERVGETFYVSWIELD